jgi:predicted nucleic acid-binding protein
MNPERYVPDTNILTALLRKDPAVIERTTIALATNAEFFLCPVVFYEMYRGLLYRDAQRQLSFFLKYTTTLTWDDFTHEDWWAAAQQWAAVREQGHQVGDADLLIGTYAMRRNAIVITANERHFTPLDVVVENWLG